MCVNPLQVKNPRFKTGTFNPNSDSYFLTVPCGHCYECLLSSQRDWIVRSFIHYDYINSIGGQAYYYTLTYNDSHILKLPVFRNSSLLCPSYTLLPDPRKVKSFLKRLNGRLARRGYDFSYFLVTEFGTRRGRPHHHAIFYINKPIDEKLFHSLVLKTWNYGFIMPGNFMGLVNSPSAIYYVCKYLSKNGKIKYFKSASVNGKSLPLLTKCLNRSFSNFKRVSNLYGWHPNILRKYLSLDYTSLTIPVDGKYKVFSLPVYYQHRLLCDSFVNVNGNISYRPNKLGWKVLSQVYKNMVSRYELITKSINAQFNTDYTVDDVLFWYLCDGIPKSQLNKSYKELFYLRHFNSGMPIRIPPDFDFKSNHHFINDFSLQRQVYFKQLNQVLSYVQYKKNKASYNVRQRVKYRDNPECLTIQNFKNYVSAIA